MEYRRLGKSGLKLSALSFGSWVTFGNQVDTSLAETCLKVAFDAGVNFFDNAEAYAKGKSETIMGAALQKLGFPRDEFCVSSKVFFGSAQDPKPNQKGLSRKHVVEACEHALKRLQVDYLDLYFCHRPDPETPIEETVRAMHDLVQQGKILYWGTSEWPADAIMEAYRIAREQHLVPPTMEQPQYNIFHRQRFEEEYASLYEDIGLGTTIWSPLASGVLTGKYADGIPDDSRMRVSGYEWLSSRVTAERVEATRKIGKIAADLGTTSTHLAIAWCLKNKNVSTVILGASRASQLEDNLKAMSAVDLLTPDVMRAVDNAVKGA